MSNTKKSATPAKKKVNPSSGQALRKPSTKKVSTTSGKERLVYSVPECVTHYLSALINPFDTPAGACLPCDLLPLPSQKCVGYTKGTFATGTTGFGFCVVYPSLVNDASSVIFTQSTSVGTASTVLATFTNLSSGVPGNLPYATADITSGNIQGRNVAYGLRARCTSSAMNRGGTYVTGESEIHFGIAQFTYTSLSSYSYARRHGIPLLVDPEAWDVSVCSSGPVILDELKYNNSAFGFTPGTIPDPLIIAVSSATPGQTFDFEYFVNVEYQGSGVGSLKTRSHASPVGFASASEAMKDATTSLGNVGSIDGPSIFDKFKTYFIEEGPQLLQIGAGALRAFAGDEAGGVAQVVGGGMKLIADSFTPHVIPARERGMSTLQRSILAPDAPHVMGFH